MGLPTQVRTLDRARVVDPGPCTRQGHGQRIQAGGRGTTRRCRYRRCRRTRSRPRARATGADARAPWCSPTSTCSRPRATGSVAVPGLTVMLDGSGLTVRKPDGTVGAVVAWAEVSGLVADEGCGRRRGARGDRRGGRRRLGRTVSWSRATIPTGSNTRSASSPATMVARSAKSGSGDQATIRSARRGARRRHRGRDRAGCPGRDRDREVLTLRHLTKRGGASHDSAIVTQSQYG